MKKKTTETYTNWYKPGDVVLLFPGPNYLIAIALPETTPELVHLTCGNLAAPYILKNSSRVKFAQHYTATDLLDLLT